MEQTAAHILDYLKRTYDPEAILVYGSFAQGRNGPHSDFDACVLTKNAERAQLRHVSEIGRRFSTCADARWAKMQLAAHTRRQSA